MPAYTAMAGRSPGTAYSPNAGTRLPTPGIAGRLNASIAGNGGQVRDNGGQVRGNGGQVRGNGGQVAGRHPVSCITS